MTTAMVLIPLLFLQSDVAPTPAQPLPFDRIIEITIDDDDPALAGHGASERVEYRVDFSGSLHVWTRSPPEVDLFLRVDAEEGTLLAEDDDSGGKPTPYVRLEVEPQRTLHITVARASPEDASHPAGTIAIELHLIAAVESEATRQAASRARDAVQQLTDHERAGEYDEARALLAYLVDDLSKVEESAPSASIASVAGDLSDHAYSVGAASTRRDALTLVLRYFERVLPTDHRQLLAARGNLAMALFGLGDLPGARALLEQVVAGFERTRPPDHPDVLMGNMNLGLTLESLGETAAAREQLERAVAGYERIGPAESLDLLRAQQNLANTLYTQGELVRARDLLARVVDVYGRTQPEDHPEFLAARASFVAVLVDTGELAAARALAERVLASYERVLPAEDPACVAVRFNLAHIARMQGDLAGARAIFEHVYEVRERSLPPDHPLRLLTQANLAIVLMSMGDLTGARDLFERTLDGYERTLRDDHPDVLMARMNLAVTLLWLGDRAGARELLERVLEVREKILSEDHPDVSMTRLNLALVLQSMGEVARAVDLLREVLQTYERTLPDYHPHVLAARIDLAIALKAQGDFTAARALLESALGTLTRTRAADDLELLSVQGDLATTLFALGDDAGAKQFIPSLVSGMKQRVSSAFSVTPREARERVGADAARIVQIWFLSGDADATVQAQVFELIETQRFASLESSRAQQLVAADSSLVPLAERVSKARADLNDLVAGTRSEAIPEAELRTALARSLRERDAAERAIRAQLAAHGVVAEPIAIDALAKALPPGSAAVGFLRQPSVRVDARTHEPISGEDHLYAHVVRTDGHLERVDLGAAQPLEELVASWRSAVGSATSARGVPAESSAAALPLERDLSARLRAELVDPLRAAAGQGVTTLFVCPDDLVYLVPMDALSTGAGCVGDELAIVTEPSFASLIHPRAATPGSGGLLALGDVEYDPSERDAKPVVALASMSSAVRSFDGSFAPLPNTREEVDSLSRAYSAAFGDEAVVLTGRDATRGALIEHAPHTRFLHLATHGWFAPESARSTSDASLAQGDAARMSFEQTVVGFAPMTLCGVALAGANAGRDALGHATGIVTAEELCTLDLTHCDLAVLSACETNVGIRRAGQGMQSLQAALHVAGAKTAITSSWRVDDRATRELMEHFYAGLWVEKLPTAQALWRAKTALRNAGRPVRDWAAWVLSGDPK